MLQILRNKSQSIVIQAVVVIIALVFIFWGVGSQLTNDRESAVTVNGEEISFQDYQQAYDRTHQQIATQFGGTLPKGLAESLGIKQQVVNQLIQQVLLRQGAEKMGIIVSEEEILSTITSMPQFQEDSGFSMDKYESLLAANRLTPNKFEMNMRHDMVTEKVVRDIGGFAALTSQHEVEELYRHDNEKVSVTFCRISPDHFKTGITVDEGELAKWFETVKENYRGEPLAKLKYFNFSFAEVGRKITIDEARIKAYYDENIAGFTIPEKRHARHILLRAGDKDSQELHKEKAQRAAELAQLAQTTDDFAALAREYSEDPNKEKGGDLGFFAKGQTVPAFDEAVFSMKPGEISKVVQTQYGYHIIKLEAIEPAAIRTLAEVHDEIRVTLQNKEAESLAFQLANSAYEGIIGVGSLQAYADKTPDQHIIETDFFPQSSPPKELAMDKEFLEQAFALKAGELSSLVKTPAGYYIIFAAEVKNPETPTLAKVKEKATTDFIAVKAAEKAKEKAAEILKRVRAGEAFATVAGDATLEIQDSGLLGRNSADQSAFPTSLTDQVFRLSKSAPYPESPAMVDQDYYVFAFQERKVPEIGANENLDRYRQVLLQAKQQELLSAFIRNLEKDAKITVHSSL